jgi:hypothetical protein
VAEYSQQPKSPDLTQGLQDGPSAYPKKKLDKNFTDESEPKITIKKSKRRKIKI